MQPLRGWALVVIIYSTIMYPLREYCFSLVEVALSLDLTINFVEVA